MARVRFSVIRDFPFAARSVFDELVDWRGHAQWVPLTRVRIEQGDGGPGTVFVATSGPLPDRMRVDSLDPERMTVRITKIGPVLSGVVDLSVSPLGESSSQLEWHEDITVPLMPGFLSGAMAAASRQGFEVALRRMERHMRASVDSR
jgi:hypothetical protein